MHQKPILVTGATGVLGHAIVRTLTEAHFAVRSAVRDKGKSREGNVYLDYLQPATFQSALEATGGLLLMAPPLDPEAAAKVTPLISQAKKADVRHIVVISALGVNFNEAAPLRIIEHQVMDSGIAYAILRPNFFMENFSEGFLSKTIKDHNGIFLAAGEGRTSFISVRDIAAVAAACFSDPSRHQELDLTGPDALDHAEVAEIISKASGRPVVYQSLTDEQMAEGARAAGVPEPAIGYLTTLYGAVRAGYVAAVTGDVQKVLGRLPISFQQFAQQNTSAWRA